MSDGVWMPITTAPKDRMILVYGRPDNTPELRFFAPAVHAAYWDECDEAFCLDGATWLGPFIKPTHWMSLPPPPQDAKSRRKQPPPPTEREVDE